MSRHRFYVPRPRIAPELVFFPLPFQETAVAAEVSKQLSLFHSTTTVSRTAPAGTPRRASSRRSSRISAIAAARLARASSDVRS